MVGAILQQALAAHVSKVVKAVTASVGSSLGPWKPMLSGIKLKDVSGEHLSMIVSSVTEGKVVLDPKTADAFVEAAIRFDGGDDSNVVDFLGKKALLMLGSLVESGEAAPLANRNTMSCPACRVTFLNTGKEGGKPEFAVIENEKTAQCPACKVTFFKDQAK